MSAVEPSGPAATLAPTYPTGEEPPVPDEVLTDDLPGDVTMRVFERSVILANGVTVWLRRFTLNPDGSRTYLADGRWCAQRGGVPHMFAAPLDATHGGTAEWLYRAVHSYPSWQDALEAAQLAEDADEADRARAAAS